MADDPRQAKLDLTISSVTPARLEATRQEMETERAKLSSPKPPPPPPPEEADPASEEAPPSDTTQRMKKLDLIQDVQLILVDKYRFGTKIMMGAVALMLLSLAGLGRLLWKSNDVYNRIEALQAEQQKLIDRGAQIERKADETNQKVDETNQKLDETKEKVNQAVENAPKIEIDEQGKAKVVVPVKTSEPGYGSKRRPRPPAAPPAPPSTSSLPSSAPLPMQVPVETKGF